MYYGDKIALENLSNDSICAIFKEGIMKNRDYGIPVYLVYVNQIFPQEKHQTQEMKKGIIKKGSMVRYKYYNRSIDDIRRCNMLALQCNNCFSLDMNYRATWENDLVCNRCGKELPMSDALVYNVKNESVINLSDNYWISKDGKIHEFKDMSAEHLRNCIKLLKRTYTKEELSGSKLFVGLTQEYMLR